MNTLVLSKSLSFQELSHCEAILVRPEVSGWAIGPRLGVGHACPDCYWHWHSMRSHWLPSLTEDQIRAAHETASAIIKRNPGADWDNNVLLFNGPEAAPSSTPFIGRADCPACRVGSASPQSLDRTLSGLANPYTGILSRIKILPDTGGLFFAHGSAFLPPPHDPVGASGVGASLPEARMKMMFEAIERHSAAYLPSDPNQVPSFKLSGEVSGTVAASHVYFGYPGVHTDSTGCAAAPTLQAAIRHAWLEIQERDALAKWWLSREPRRRVEIPDDPHSWALDLSSNRKVFVAVALSAQPNGTEVYLGAAADSTWESALRRASMELTQFKVWDRLTGVPADRRVWMSTYTLRKNPWLAGDPNAPPAKRADPAWNAVWVDLTRPSIGIPAVRVICPGLRSTSSLDFPL